MEINMSSDIGHIYKVNVELLSNEPIDFDELRRFLESYESTRTRQYTPSSQNPFAPFTVGGSYHAEHAPVNNSVSASRPSTASPPEPDPDEVWMREMVEKMPSPPKPKEINTKADNPIDSLEL